MNRFWKILSVLTLVTALSALGLQAATDVAAGEPAGAAAHGGHGAGPLVTPDAPELWNVAGIPITNSMLYAWIVTAVLCLFVQRATRRMKEVPTGAQNVLEALIEGWESLSLGILEPKVTRWVFPVAVTFFFFALTSNIMGLLPGVGSIGWGHADSSSSLPFAVQHADTPLFRPPTADANMTIVMALTFLAMSLYWAVRYNGPLGLVKHIFGVKVESNKWAYMPLFLMFLFVGLMEVLSIVLVRPLALAVRLYGNIFSGETLLAMMMSGKPLYLSVLAALPFYFLELFVAVAQAFVFAMLTLAFVGTLCSHTEDEHGH